MLTQCRVIWSCFKWFTWHCGVQVVPSSTTVLIMNQCGSRRHSTAPAWTTAHQHVAIRQLMAVDTWTMVMEVISSRVDILTSNLVLHNSKLMVRVLLLLLLLLFRLWCSCWSRNNKCYNFLRWHSLFVVWVFNDFCCVWIDFYIRYMRRLCYEICLSRSVEAVVDYYRKFWHLLQLPS